MTTSSVAPFAEYVDQHKEPGAAVFVDQDAMTAVAVLNLGTPDQPGHADNIAKMVAKRMAAFAALLQHASGGGLAQAKAARKTRIKAEAARLIEATDWKLSRAREREAAGWATLAEVDAVHRAPDHQA